VAGSYSRWVHLGCWRVPSTVWLNLPASYGADPVAFRAAVLELESITLCGFAALDEGQQMEVLAHLADKRNWASPNKKALADAEAFLADRKSKGAAAAAAAQTAAGRPSLGGGGDAVALVEPHGPSDALVVAGGRGTVFKLPRPGVGSARAGALAGMTFVLTGVYPEVGGGSGLDLGKGRVESFIASFGGRVTSAISGKTNYLVVGASPGRVKVEKAQETGIKMVDIQYLAAFVEGPAGTNLRDAPPPVLDAFSKGYPSKKQIAANAAREAGLLQGGAPAKAAPKRKRKVKEEDDYEEDD
jgi:BRCA1 C Terminus (BRCT) domain